MSRNQTPTKNVPQLTNQPFTTNQQPNQKTNRKTIEQTKVHPD